MGNVILLQICGYVNRSALFICAGTSSRSRRSATCAVRPSVGHGVYVQIALSTKVQFTKADKPHAQVTDAVLLVPHPVQQCLLQVAWQRVRAGTEQRQLVPAAEHRVACCLAQDRMVRVQAQGQRPFSSMVRQSASQHSPVIRRIIGPTLLSVRPYGDLGDDRLCRGGRGRWRGRGRYRWRRCLSRWKMNPS